MHAYIETVDPLYNDHHEIIAARYVDPMADYLKSYFNMSVTDAYALSWSGVQDSKIYSEATASTLFILGKDGPSVSRSELHGRSAAYNSTNEYSDEGVKGKSICDTSNN